MARSRQAVRTTRSDGHRRSVKRKCREACAAAGATTLVWLYGDTQVGQAGRGHVPDFAFEGGAGRAEVEFLTHNFLIALAPVLRHGQCGDLGTARHRLLGFERDLADRLWHVEDENEGLLAFRRRDPSGATRSIAAVEQMIHRVLGRLGRDEHGCQRGNVQAGRPASSSGDGSREPARPRWDDVLSQHDGLLSPAGATKAAAGSLSRAFACIARIQRANPAVPKPSYGAGAAKIAAVSFDRPLASRKTDRVGKIAL